MMMGIGSLAVVADQAPKNLAILVLDNEQVLRDRPSARPDVRQRTDLCAVAEGFGIGQHHAGHRAGARHRSCADFCFKTPGPIFAVAKIAITDDPWRLPEKDGATIARRFKGRSASEPATPAHQRPRTTRMLRHCLFAVRLCLWQH